MHSWRWCTAERQALPAQACCHTRCAGWAARPVSRNAQHSTHAAGACGECRPRAQPAHPCRAAPAGAGCPPGQAALPSAGWTGACRPSRQPAPTGIGAPAPRQGPKRAGTARCQAPPPPRTRSRLGRRRSSGARRRRVHASRSRAAPGCRSCAGAFPGCWLARRARGRAGRRRCCRLPGPAPYKAAGCWHQGTMAVRAGSAARGSCGLLAAVAPPADSRACSLCRARAGCALSSQQGLLARKSRASAAEWLQEVARQGQAALHQKSAHPTLGPAAPAAAAARGLAAHPTERRPGWQQQDAS